MDTKDDITIHLTKTGLTIILIGIVSLLIVLLSLNRSNKIKEFMTHQTMLLIQVNQLKSINDNLAEQISELESDIDDLKGRIEQLE